MVRRSLNVMLTYYIYVMQHNTIVHSHYISLYIFWEWLREMYIKMYIYIYKYIYIYSLYIYTDQCMYTISGLYGYTWILILE